MRPQVSGDMPLPSARIPSTHAPTAAPESGLLQGWEHSKTRSSHSERGGGGGAEAPELYSYNYPTTPIVQRQVETGLQPASPRHARWAVLSITCVSRRVKDTKVVVVKNRKRVVNMTPILKTRNLPMSWPRASRTHSVPAGSQLGLNRCWTIEVKILAYGCF